MIPPVSITSATREAFPQTCSALEQALREGVAPGFVAGIGHWSPRGRSQDNQAYVLAMGQRRLEPSPLPLTAQTIFDLASLTKVLATAPLAALLVERGWLSWSSSVASFFPGYPFPEIEVRHLLSHTAGFAAWQPFWQTLRDHFAPRGLERVPVGERQRLMREVILKVAPEVPTGTRALYSDVSFMLLGFIIEEVLKIPLDRAVRTLLWEPMGVRASYHRTTRAPGYAYPNVAATERSPWHGVVLEGQVHDENCWAMGGYSGHAGAFGTIEDVLRVAGSLLGGFLTPKTLREMWTRASRPEGCERTLGWDTPTGNESSAGRYFSDASVGHLGFTGTSLWIDPEAGVAVALLSNRVHPTRDNIAIRQFRPIFHDAIRSDFSALVDSFRARSS